MSPIGALKFRRSIIFFMLPAFIIYLVFFIYSFGRTFYYSFFQWNGLSKPLFIGIQNYIQLAGDELFTMGIGRVLLWALLSVIFKVGIALVLASLLRRAIRGHKFFTTAFFVPVIISSAAIGLMFTLIYDLDVGVLNTFLRSNGLGFLTRSWLGDQSTAFLSVVVVDIYHNIGYYFIILLAGLQNISEEIYESAKMDGVTTRVEFTKITLPLIWPVLQICIILTMTSAMKSFDYIFIMTKGGPGNATQVPATYMYETIFMGMNYGYGMAIAFTIFLFSLTITLLFRKLTNLMND